VCTVLFFVAHSTVPRTIPNPSLSADCRVAAIPLGGVSPWVQTVSDVLIALIAIALMFLSIALLSGYALPTLRIL